MSRKHSDEIRIGARAYYMLGKSLAEIQHLCGVTGNAVVHWIKRIGSFKLRKSRNDQPVE